jgi:type IV secretory pathway TraG/TraD family ATPase VirD4
VGVRGTERTSVGFDDAALGRHVLFLGGIGTGKTVGMSALVESIRAVANPDDVLVFFDTKGDYLEQFYVEGDAVVARATGVGHPGHVTWNLFTELAATPIGYEVAEEVDEVASSLFGDVAEAAGDNNRIWSNIAQDVFAALVLALVRDGQPHSNADIRRFVDSMTSADMRALIEPHADLRGVTQYIAKDGSNTTMSVLVFLQQAVRRVFRASFRAEGAFSVREFIRRKSGRALFLEYDVSSGETLTPVFRTILDLALKEALGRRRADGRVFVILDEFSLLPKLRHIDAGLNFGRSLGLRFVVGTQNVGQVMSAYGPDVGGSVLAGFGSVFSFRLYDSTSRDYVRARFGGNRRVVRYDSFVRNRGVVEGLVEGHLIEDWDLTGLHTGQCIAAIAEQPPVLFQFAPPEAR